jgi:2-polyprenyl-6-hydroxyphenyl methylase/3-demethylubiquinone-9 3-methyltransferase
MQLKQKIRNVIRRIKQSYGSAETKRTLWNTEFRDGRWDFIENTQGDVLYSFVRKHCRNGRILDLGCGSGNTGCELDADVYSEYTGVDISDNALAKAATRSEQAGRKGKNRYIQGDIVTYVPDRKFDVILFRESIYYVPRSKILPLLARYAEWLAPEGVMIVRWHDQKKGPDFLGLLRSDFDIVESLSDGANGPFLVSFRPSARNASAV